MNVFAFTWIDKADKHSCKDLFLFLVFLSLSCFWVVSKWRKSIERTHETQKNFVLLSHCFNSDILYCWVTKNKNKDCRCENRQRSFTITNLFQRRKQSYTRIDLWKRCRTLVSVCSEMGKKKKETLLNLHGETEVFNKWSKNLANL